MSLLVREPQSSRRDMPRWSFLLAGTVLAGLCAFLLLPGSIASKTHLALHGICAQRPSHSLQLGGSTLPLDTRMTGLYIGAVATGLWLLAAGRMRSTRIPPRAVIAVLGLFVAPLAADGFNALAFDLGLPHPYAPSNTLRLATGVLGGITLGVVLAHLVAGTMWARGDRSQAVVRHCREVLAPVCIAGAIGAIALSGMPMLFAPFAVGLLLAAIAVFGVLAMIAIALVSNRAWSCSSYRELGSLACAGLIAAAIVIGALSWARLLAESLLALPRLT